MAREKKAKTIDKLQEIFSKSSISILTDFRGLPTAEITRLRRRLQEAGSDYKVVKNTLARFAAERAGQKDLVNVLEGPIAIVFGFDDITKPAKVLTTYIKETSSSLSIKGGFSGNKLLTPIEIRTLATLPSREVLLSRVLGQMKAPISSLLTCLTSPMSGIIGVLQARIKQLEVK